MTYQPSDLRRSKWTPCPECGRPTVPSHTCDCSPPLCENCKTGHAHNHETTCGPDKSPCGHPASSLELRCRDCRDVALDVLESERDAALAEAEDALKAARAVEYAALRYAYSRRPEPVPFDKLPAQRKQRMHEEFLTHLEAADSQPEGSRQ